MISTTTITKLSMKEEENKPSKYNLELPESDCLTCHLEFMLHWSFATSIITG